MSDITTYTKNLERQLAELDQTWQTHLNQTRERLHRERTILELEKQFTSLHAAITNRNYYLLEQTLTALYTLKEYHIVQDGEFYLQ